MPCPSILAKPRRQVLPLEFVEAASPALYALGPQSCFQLIDCILGRKYLLYHTYPTMLLLLMWARTQKGTVHHCSRCGHMCGVTHAYPSSQTKSVCLISNGYRATAHEPDMHSQRA